MPCGILKNYIKNIKDKKGKHNNYIIQFCMATQQKLNPNFVMYMHRTISDTYQNHEAIIHRPFIVKSDKLKQQGTQYHIS